MSEDRSLEWLELVTARKGWGGIRLGDGSRQQSCCSLSLSSLTYRMGFIISVPAPTLVGNVIGVK